MKIQINGKFLNIQENNKKDGGKYYTFSFLDDEDESTKLFISSTDYGIINRMKLKRFEDVLILANLYRSKDGLNLSFIDILKDEFSSSADRMAESDGKGPAASAVGSNNKK